jgi:hypothetical protein
MNGEMEVKRQRKGGIMVAPSEITPPLMTDPPIAPPEEIKMAKKIINHPLSPYPMALKSEKLEER